MKLNFSAGTKGNLVGNWGQMGANITDVVKNDVQAQAMMNLMQDLREDVALPDGTGYYLGFLRAPAAKGNHHDYEGGLIHHLLEMWSLWGNLRDRFLSPPYITDERVLTAILMHDLHKAYLTYRLVQTEPTWYVDYGKDQTDTLMTQDVKSLWIAMRAGIMLDPEQVNALLWAEGGFSKTQPKFCSVLAKVCYTLDELSGNGLARIEKGTFLDHRVSEPRTAGGSY